MLWIIRPRPGDRLFGNNYLLQLAERENDRVKEEEEEEEMCGVQESQQGKGKTQKRKPEMKSIETRDEEHRKQSRDEVLGMELEIVEQLRVVVVVYLCAASPCGWLLYLTPLTPACVIARYICFI